MTKPTRLLLALFLASTAALGITGCTASPSSVGSSGADQSVTQADTAVSEDAESDPAVVIEGRVVITADDPIAAADQATEIAIAAGGRVDSRAEIASEVAGETTSELTMRVPATSVEDVRLALRDIGTVEETALETAEVGGQQRDLEARIATLNTSLARYGEWLAAADKTSDLIDLEAAIAERQSELELLESELRALEDQVAMSTITVSIHSVYTPQVTAPRDLGEALALGWTGFTGFWTAVAISLGVGLPWLVLLAIIGAFVVWRVAKSRRRAREHVSQHPAHPALFTVAGGAVPPADPAPVD